LAYQIQFGWFFEKTGKIRAKLELELESDLIPIRFLLTGIATKGSNPPN
jgi:hypothetical protein